MTLSGFQTMSQKLAEVTFREKLARQHTAGEELLPDYYDRQEHDQILAGRMNDTLNQMTALKQRGIPLSPFVEVGAERCQRSLVLVNQLGATGFAADISYHQLTTAEYFAGKNGFAKLPVRICCDVIHLPIKSASVPFVFCYEFLHHFPELSPVIRSLHRILTDGWFFFGEEPFKRPQIVLFRQKHKTSSKQYAKRHRVFRFLARFFSEERCDEREHGILENHQIPLGEWADALSVFERREVKVLSLEKRLQSRMDGRPGFANVLNRMFGGGIEGLCRKAGAEGSKAPPENILELLVCPECLAGDLRTEVTLHQDGGRFVCPECGAGYPVINGVIFLFRKEVFVRLYPQFAALEETRKSGNG
jgi:ubiquinone/menaquinone biosynthesis C-methylase UbiE/uncharacterized protein YbaR (Trm112 family)